MCQELRTVRAGGYRTRYIEAGDKDALPVVLIHDGAYGSDASLSWDGMIEGLRTDYHVLAPDLAGWGGTDKVVYFDRSPYESRIEQIAAFCDTLALDRDVHFVGTSFGGSLVLRAAAMSTVWPMRTGTSVSGAGGPYRIPEMFRQLSNYTPSLTEAERITSLLVADTSGLEEHIQRRFNNSLLPGHWEAMSAPRLRNPPAEPKQQIGDPFPESLRNCPVPLLLVEGTKDTLLERGWSQRLAEFCANGESIHLECGHCPNIETPKLLLETVTGFWRRAMAQ